MERTSLKPGVDLDISHLEVDVELRQYLALFRKWAWLVFLTTVIAAGSSYVFSSTITPTYQAETTVLVGRVVDNPNPVTNEVQSTANLVQAYVLVATQPAVLQATAEATHFPGSWQALFFKIKVTTVGGQLLKISVLDADPQAARALADEVARQLILKGPVSAQQKQAEEQASFVGSQLTQLKQQIETAQSTLMTLSNQVALENDPANLSDLNVRISALQTKIAEWQKNYASLSALLSSGSSPFVTVLAPAQLPVTPVSPNIPQNVLFAGLAGLVLAGGAILLLEYLDDTIKGAEDVERDLELNTLGAIHRFSGIREAQDHLITMKHPRSPVTEAYRVLRTNLRFSEIDSSGTLLVTSSGPGEGKTTTAANLAVILAQAGRRVLLLDTDLRRPNLHRFFDLPNEVGLSNLILGDAPTTDAVIQTTAIEGLKLITSGPLPPNPAEVLDSDRMSEILAHLRTEADVLILDSPPVLAVADASILGSRCAGVIMVVDAGHTRTDACRRALETLLRTGAKVHGVVLNKLSPRRSTGYYYNYYYYKPSRDGQPGRNGHQHPKKEPEALAR